MSQEHEKLHLTSEILVLDLISKHAKSYHYIVSCRKELFEAIIPLNVLIKFGRNALQFGTVVNGTFSLDENEKKIQVETVRNIFMLSKAKNNKWTELKLEFSDTLKKHVIQCSALTNGCFTYMDKEYTSPAVFNDVLGILVDNLAEKRIPAKEIGRLICTVTTEQKEDGKWQLRIENVKNFEKVFSLAQSAIVEDNEHFGLVTREECEVKRDLRLVSSRDFPRDVRIFRSGSHCCESNDVGLRRPHLHQQCLNTCVGDVNLIGRCVAFKMKRCLGMCGHSEGVIPSASEGRHVDSRELREDVTQLEVHVHGGFVEVETIAEYSGFTDHQGQPLLWSHDVEFVVDIAGIFRERDRGLYTVKVVRFHRSNVFAKWRLARRDPIIKSMQTRFHSQSAHSINLATMGIQDLWISNNSTAKVPKDEEDEDTVVEQRQRLPSFSRFGNASHKGGSLCLPRTDSLDRVELFEALLRNDRCSSAATSFSYGSTAHSEELVENVYEEDASLWMHHDSSVLKIVEDSEDVNEVTFHVDENSNDVVF